MTHSPIATTARPGPRPTLRAWTALALFAAAVSSPAALGQSCESWVNEGDTGLQGVDGTIGPIVNWDPDGDGNANVIVLGGSFDVAGYTLAKNIVMWDPDTDTWTRFATEPGWQVNGLIVLADGRLVASGYTLDSSNVYTSHVAIWESPQWREIGTANGLISSITEYPDDFIVAGGKFSSIGGVDTTNVAMWDGRSWLPMGSGIPSQNTFGVASVAYLPHAGILMASGSFQNNTCRAIAQWNGTAWSQMGTNPIPSGNYYETYGLWLDRFGAPYLSGRFTTSFDTYEVRTWDSSQWSVFRTGRPAAMAFSPGNAVSNSYERTFTAIGNFSSAPQFSCSINGTTVYRLADRGVGMTYRPDGTMILTQLRRSGTRTTSSNDGHHPHVVPDQTFDGIALASSSGLRQTNGNPDLYFGFRLLPTRDGMLASIGRGAPDGYRLKTRAGEWTEIGLPRNSWVPTSATAFGPMYSYASVEKADGTLMASYGQFIVQRLPGSSQWVQCGGTTGYTERTLPRTTDLIEMPGRQIVAAGEGFAWFGPAGLRNYSSICRWDGTNWNDMGGGIGPFGFNAYPVRLALTPSGHLIAAGNFTAAGGVANTNGIARWDGSAWNSVAPGTNSGILAIAVRPNGNIIATGSFTALGGTPVNRIAEWDGSAWRPFGSGLTEPAAQGRAIALAPNGDVILGGHFAAVGGIAADNVARWNGHAWRAVGDGLGFPGDTPSTDEGVNDLKFDPATGDLWAAGTFVASGGRLVMGIARVTLATQYADITQQPTPAAGCPGEPASFTIRVQSAAPVTYRWSHNGAPIDSATNPSALSDTLVIPAVAPADAGEYRCTVTDGCTSTPSTPATLTYLACCPDFDLDGNADQADVWYLINAVTGGPNPSGRDLDFNHDGSTDMTDVDALVNTIAGAGCP